MAEHLYNIYTVESRDYAPPFVHARIGQKWGGGLYAGSLHFRVTTITDRRMPRGRAISVLSLAVWWAKLEKNDKVRHNMTQIASLLAVATVFVDLWAPFYSQGGGGLIREIKVPMQELELKMQGGGLMREGGRNRGILRYYNIKNSCCECSQPYPDIAWLALY